MGLFSEITIIHSAYNEVVSGGTYNTSYSYDKHGNVLTLVRNSGTLGAIDNLTFKYDGMGNQVKFITDAYTGTLPSTSADFKPNKSNTNPYTYNKNGAMTYDPNKGMNVTYNALNLPRELLINNETARGKNYYTYTATGAKLQVKHLSDPTLQTVPVTGTSADSKYKVQNTTDYIGNKIYENGVLNKTLIDNGYIEGNNYYFYIKDHLGNNRIVASATGTVVQRNNYYPFGMSFGEESDAEQGKQNFKYNNKELDKEHGLNQYDYAARFMDPSMIRFTTIDPHAENYFSWSPYTYVGNNPIKRIDPTGMDWYEDEDGNAMWFRNRTSSTYRDADDKDWTRVGTSYSTISGNTLYNFEQKVNDEGNQYLTGSKYEIVDEKQVKMQANKEAVRNWQSTDASRNAQQRFWDNPTMGNWFKYLLTEVIGQYSDPVRVVGGLSTGIAGYTAMSPKEVSPNVQFGRVSNQVYHTFRHTNQLGISQVAVTSAVQADLRTIATGIQSGQAINRIITVSGQNLQYTVFKLADGTLNVGRIHGI